MPSFEGSLARDDSSSPGERSRERVTLARKWAYLLSQTAFLPWRHAELEEHLIHAVDELVDAVGAEPTVAAQHAAVVGRRLVEWHCTDPASLRCTVETLGKGLSGLREVRTVNGLAERVITLLASLTSAYTDASRLFAVERQETLNRALLRAIREETGQRLKAGDDRFNAVLANSPNGIAITDPHGKFVNRNEMFVRILGYPAGQLDKLSLFDAIRLERGESLRELYDELGDGLVERVRKTQRLRRNDGEAAGHITLTATLLRGVGVPRHFLTVLEDVGELALLQDELLRQALHDVLTGLPNRQFFTTRLESMLHAVDPGAGGLTLYHLDLDAFSVIVGGFGRQVAERLLSAVGERLRTVVHGEHAMVARFDGDEFAILVENSPTTPDVVSTVERIKDALFTPIELDDHRLVVTACIGVVDRPPATMSSTALLAGAEMALRRAQRNGRGQWGLFDPEQDADEQRMLRSAATLPAAWQAGEIGVTYRPLVRLAADGVPAGEVIGQEARLCWTRPDAEALAHDRCVELAERTGVILPLGKWLLRSVCEQAARSGPAGDGPPPHVDLTGEQASDPDLLALVVRILADTGLRPERLRLGIPASQVLDGGEAPHTARMLAGMGVGIVLLEFGADPAHLRYLAEQPVYAVRLADWPADDANNVGDTATAAVRAALVAAVRELGAEVIAPESG